MRGIAHEYDRLGELIRSSSRVPLGSALLGPVPQFLGAACRAKSWVRASWAESTRQETPQASTGGRRRRGGKDIIKPEPGEPPRFFDVGTGDRGMIRCRLPRHHQLVELQNEPLEVCVSRGKELRVQERLLPFTAMHLADPINQEPAALETEVAEIMGVGLEDRHRAPVAQSAFRQPCAQDGIVSRSGFGPRSFAPGCDKVGIAEIASAAFDLQICGFLRWVTYRLSCDIRDCDQIRRG